MNLKEKILLIEFILRDIRCDWSCSLEERLEMALALIKEIQGEKDIEGMDLLKFNIEEFLNDCNSNYDVDGRAFRTSYPYGYEEMEKVHNLQKTHNDKSEVFKSELLKLNRPESYVQDWNENNYL